MSLSSFIASVGANPNFIAFNAHCFFAAFLVSVVGHCGWSAGAIVALAAVKEFWFDKHYEVDQSFLDNLLDWSGYATGALLGCAAVALR